MSIGLGAPQKSPLGAFVKSPLGARGFRDQEPEITQGDIYVGVDAGRWRWKDIEVVRQQHTVGITSLDAATEYGLTVNGVTVSVPAEGTIEATVQAVVNALNASEAPEHAGITWTRTGFGDSSQARGVHLQSTWTLATYVDGGTGAWGSISTSTSLYRVLRYNKDADAWEGVGLTSVSSSAPVALAFYAGNLYAAWGGLRRWNHSAGTWSLIQSGTCTALAVADGKLWSGWTGTANILRSWNGTTNAVETPPTNLDNIQGLSALLDGSGFHAWGPVSGGAGDSGHSMAVGLPGSYTEAGIMSEIFTSIQDIQQTTEGSIVAVYSGSGTSTIKWRDIATETYIGTQEAALWAWTPGTDAVSPFGGVDGHDFGWARFTRRVREHGDDIYVACNVFAGDPAAVETYGIGIATPSTTSSVDDGLCPDTDTGIPIYALEPYGDALLIGGAHTGLKRTSSTCEITGFRGFSRIVGGVHSLFPDVLGLTASGNVTSILHLTDPLS